MIYISVIKKAKFLLLLFFPITGRQIHERNLLISSKFKKLVWSPLPNLPNQFYDKWRILTEKHQVTSSNLCVQPYPLLLQVFSWISWMNSTLQKKKKLDELFLSAFRYSFTHVLMVHWVQQWIEMNPKEFLHNFLEATGTYTAKCHWPSCHGERNSQVTWSWIARVSQHAPRVAVITQISVQI